jgi:hypothetical protein
MTSFKYTGSSIEDMFLYRVVYHNVKSEGFLRSQVHRACTGVWLGTPYIVVSARWCTSPTAQMSMKKVHETSKISVVC